MIGFFIAVHALACIVLVVFILMQSGRGGGLTEAFASAESMFGAKTNQFMVRTTAVFVAVFFITSLSLAYLSAQKGKSLMADKVVSEENELPETTTQPETASQPESSPVESE